MWIAEDARVREPIQRTYCIPQILVELGRVVEIMRQEWPTFRKKSSNAIKCFLSPSSMANSWKWLVVGSIILKTVDQASSLQVTVEHEDKPPSSMQWTLNFRGGHPVCPCIIFRWMLKPFQDLISQAPLPCHYNKQMCKKVDSKINQIRRWDIFCGPNTLSNSQSLHQAMNKLQVFCSRRNHINGLSKLLLCTTDDKARYAWATSSGPVSSHHQ